MDSKIKNIIIGIIAITILGLSCYFIYNKYSDEGNNENKKIIDNDKRIQEDLISIIKEYGLDALSYEEKDITFSEMPRNSQLYLAAQYYEKTNKNKDYVFTREELDDYYEKIYGFKPSSYPNIKCQIDKEDLYTYKENKYIKNTSHSNHVNYTSNMIDSYVVEYSNNDNLYTISILFLHGNKVEGYKVNESPLFKDNEEHNGYSNEKLIKYFKDNINEFMNINKYQYVFEKNSGRYILKSFKKVN